MKRITVISVLVFITFVLVACASEPVEVTRIVETETEVEVEVTRLVETEVEITRLVETKVEVTRVVEVPLEVTRIVKVTRIVSEDANQVENTENSTNTDGVLSIGEEGRDGEQIYLVKEWSEVESITSKRGEEVYPSEGGKFVIIKFDVFNDGFDEDDIYCSFDMGETLIDDLGREFEYAGSAGSIDPYNIEGNLGCRDGLQPGFGHDNQILAFMIPADATPVYLKLWDPNELPDRNDPLGIDSSVMYLLEPEVDTSSSANEEEAVSAEAPGLDLNSFTDTWTWTVKGEEGMEDDEYILNVYEFHDDGSLTQEVTLALRTEDSAPQPITATYTGSWQYQGGSTVCLIDSETVCSEWTIEGDLLIRDNGNQIYTRS